jgi:hypothetical protein
MARTCKMCSAEFQVERKRGQPRKYCFTCQPEGWKIVRKPHRTKLRRVHPVGPRIPKGGWASVTRIAP